MWEKLFCNYGKDNFYRKPLPKLPLKDFAIWTNPMVKMKLHEILKNNWSGGWGSLSKKKMKLHEILKNNLSVDWGSLPKKLVISYYNTY